MFDFQLSRDVFVDLTFPDFVINLKDRNRYFLINLRILDILLFQNYKYILYIYANSYFFIDIDNEMKHQEKYVSSIKYCK